MKKHKIVTSTTPDFKSMVHHGKQHPGFAAGAKKANAAPMPQPEGGMGALMGGGAPMPAGPMGPGGPGKC
jgi:hypothetical protein